MPRPKPLPRVLRPALPWLARRLAARPRLERFPRYHWLAGESPSARLRTLRRRVLASMGRPLDLPWIEGLRLRLHPHDDTAECVFLTGLFEPNEMSWFRGALRPGMTVVDVGANCGLYTMLAARRVGAGGRVVAIEASPREQARLADHVDLNALENVTIIPAAAGEAAGRASLRMAQWPHAGQNTLGDFIYRGVGTAQVCEVEVTTVDRVVRDLALDRVDVMKIDAEGADVLVLRGAEETLRRFSPTLLIEVNDPTLAHQKCQSGEIWDILERHGYEVLSFDAGTGELAPAARQAHYADTVNLVATRRAAQLEQAAA